MKIHNIYLGMRMPKEHITKILVQMQNAFDLHPGAVASFSGLSYEGDKVLLTVRIQVPRSNTEPAALSALQLAQYINSSFYDYMPHHKEVPTEYEIRAMQSVRDKMYQIEMEQTYAYN